MKQVFFSCLCGLRVSDIRKLKWNDLQKSGDFRGASLYGYGTEREAGSAGNASQLGGNTRTVGAIEQALSKLHSNLAVPIEKLQTIQSQLDDIRNRMQGQQHIGDTKKITLETYRNFRIMVDILNSYKTNKEEVALLPFY